MEAPFNLDPLLSPNALRSPVLRDLHAAWMAAGGEGDLPLEADMDLDGLGPVADHLWWFRAIDGGADFQGLRFGAQTMRTYGDVPLGQSIMRMGKNPIIARALAVLRRTALERRPFRFFSEMSVIPGWDFYDIEVLALPLRDEGGRVASVLGATVGRLASGACCPAVPKR